MLLFSIQSFALYFFVELILRTTGVELKTNGMDADPTFHLRPDCSHIRSDLPDRLALGLL
ncbi:MAG: hypothetical protein ACLUD2_11805 [Clostridium sp.]